MYGLYMFSYELWDISFVGNRFLLPSIYLYLLNFIPWCCALWERRAEHGLARTRPSSVAEGFEAGAGGG